jgi:AcrR family transcriptional regulator
MTTRPRGRRPAGSQTRDAILAAARAQFGALGYEHTTLRSVAEEAGVDSRLVLHYFGSKRELFVQSVQLPVEPEVLLARVFGTRETKADDAGALVADALLGILDHADTRQMAVALIRAAASEPEAAELIREVLTERVLLPLADRLVSDQPRLRASLCASQFVGLAMARYVVGIEPLASASREQLVRALAPVFEHYLFGDWTVPTPAADQPARGSPS